MKLNWNTKITSKDKKKWNIKNLCQQPRWRSSEPRRWLHRPFWPDLLPHAPLLAPSLRRLARHPSSYVRRGKQSSRRCFGTPLEFLSISNGTALIIASIVVIKLIWLISMFRYTFITFTIKSPSGLIFKYLKSSSNWKLKFQYVTVNENNSLICLIIILQLITFNIIYIKRRIIRF